MAANQLKITGLEELKQDLRNLPKELVAEATVIIHAQATAAFSGMAAAYAQHSKSGNLAGNLRMEEHADAVSATAKIRNSAKHAYLFEKGTKAERHWKKNGKSTGIMPAGRVLIPIAQQRRRIMEIALIDLVNRSGLHVSGSI